MAEWKGKPLVVDENNEKDDDPTDEETRAAVDNWAHMDGKLKGRILQLEMEARQEAKDAGVKPIGT